MMQGKTNGLKSSEFLLTLMGMLGGVLCAVFSGSQWAEIGGAVLASVCGASYSQARATVKRAIASAEGLEKAAEAGKPSGSQGE